MNYAHVGCARYVIDGTYRATGLFEAGYLGLGRHSQPRQVKRDASHRCCQRQHWWKKKLGVGAAAELIPPSGRFGL